MNVRGESDPEEAVVLVPVGIDGMRVGPRVEVDDAVFDELMRLAGRKVHA
ncbi:MAG: hypothetical protein HGA44_08095 [Cellulomonadaceae bacterium]|nr:hypothetical protein [Cellulomonadaceae bacterium]